MTITTVKISISADGGGLVRSSTEYDVTDADFRSLDVEPPLSQLSAQTRTFLHQQLDGLLNLNWPQMGRPE